MTHIFLSHIWVRHSCVGTSKLMLSLTSTIILDSESHDTHDCILLSHNSGSHATVGQLICQVNCCWLSPAQSFLVLCPMGLITVFYRLTSSSNFLCCCLHIHCCRNVFTEPLSINECLLCLYYSSFRASCDSLLSLTNQPAQWSRVLEKQTTMIFHFFKLHNPRNTWDILDLFDTDMPLLKRVNLYVNFGQIS
jgi:hypothetical protein